MADMLAKKLSRKIFSHWLIGEQLHEAKIEVCLGARMIAFIKFKWNAQGKCMPR
jgi:hypothetical protein